jgi:hypothetical protein
MTKSDVSKEITSEGKDGGEEMWVQAFFHDLHRKSKMFGRQHVQLKIKGGKVPSWRAANQAIRDRYVFMASAWILSKSPSWPIVVIMYWFVFLFQVIFLLMWNIFCFAGKIHL